MRTHEYAVEAVGLHRSLPLGSEQVHILKGISFTIAGEGIRIWAAGHLEKNREVTRSGPYRFTAHPLYVGSTVMAAGIALAARSLAVALVAALYMGLTIPAAIRTEELDLRQAFGSTYDDYVTSTILRPLGMTSTTLHADRVPKGRLAIGYRWEDERWKEEPALPHGSFGAMGGMLTTIRDLSRYVSMYLDAWPARDGAETGPVRRASLREMQQPWRPSTTRVVLDKANVAAHLTATSYGYGLSHTQTCQFRSAIAHSGGLPGYGSLMRWLPDYGVGIMAFGSLTYTGWGNAVGAAFDRLERTGGLVRRQVVPSAALVAARDDVSRLVIRWDDGLADRIAAENLFLDRSKDRRQRDIQDLTAKVGQSVVLSALVTDDMVPERPSETQSGQNHAELGVYWSHFRGPGAPERVAAISTQEAIAAG